MRRGLLVVVGFCFLFTTPAMAQQARLALVIGIGNYKAVPALRNPPQDARAMAAKLRGLGFQTDLVVDPDRSGLERAIRGFGDKARNAEVALVYYAGHALEFGGQNYIVPVSADLHSARDIPFETVPMDLIQSQLEGQAHVVMLFLDACRDNPFAARIAAGQRGLASRGLAVASTAATGTLIVYATAPGQTADDGAGQDSPFTTALLTHIDEPGLEVRQVLSRVRRDVRNATNGVQVPWESSSLEGDFYFRPAALTTAQPPPPALPQNAVPRVAAPPEQPRSQGIVPKQDAAQNPVPQPTQEAAARPVVPAPQPPNPAPQAPHASAALPPSVACQIPHFTGVSTGAGAVARMLVVNSGHRCRVHLETPGGFPYISLTLTKSPMHGAVTIEGNAFYYRPSPGYAGPDEFAIETSPSGSVRTIVTVVAPEALPR